MDQEHLVKCDPNPSVWDIIGADRAYYCIALQPFKTCYTCVFHDGLPLKPTSQKEQEHFAKSDPNPSVWDIIGADRAYYCIVLQPFKTCYTRVFHDGLPRWPTGQMEEERLAMSDPNPSVWGSFCCWPMFENIATLQR